MNKSRWIPGHPWLCKKLGEEQGSVLVISLMVLVVLALLGAIASNMSITEMQSASNEKRYNQIFYLADSGWQAAPDFLNTISDAPVAKASCGGGLIVDCGTTTINGIPYTYTVSEIVPPRFIARSGLAPGTPVHQYQVVATADGRQTIQVVLNKPYIIPD